MRLLWLFGVVFVFVIKKMGYYHLTFSNSKYRSEVSFFRSASFEILIFEFKSNLKTCICQNFDLSLHIK